MVMSVWLFYCKVTIFPLHLKNILCVCEGVYFEACEHPGSHHTLIQF